MVNKILLKFLIVHETLAWKDGNNSVLCGIWVAGPMYRVLQSQRKETDCSVGVRMWFQEGFDVDIMSTFGVIGMLKGEQ